VPTCCIVWPLAMVRHSHTRCCCCCCCCCCHICTLTCTFTDKARASIGQEGVIPHLVTMLSSDSKAVKNHAALTLASLVKGVNKNKVALMKADGVPPLIKIFTGNSDAKLVENVTSVMRNLATNGSIAAEIVKGGIVPKLIAAVKDSATAPPQLAETIHLLTNIASHGMLQQQQQQHLLLLLLLFLNCLYRGSS